MGCSSSTNKDVIEQKDKTKTEDKTEDQVENIETENTTEEATEGQEATGEDVTDAETGGDKPDGA